MHFRRREVDGICAVQSACLNGVEAQPVIVEVSIGSELPGMSIVGMADTAVQEARERVRSAIKKSGFSMPSQRVIVNLAPSNIRKTGSGFDLPIACGILAATRQISASAIEGKLLVGELSLQGHVRPVIGSLAFAVCAKRLGLQFVSAVQDPAPLNDLMQMGVSNLGMLHTSEPFEDLNKRSAGSGISEDACDRDYKDIYGHDVAKRAFQIAAAGCHGLLMMGPPGSGKTMLASRMTSILPPLSEEEMLEAAVVHSVAGESIEHILAGMRPFRSPHHSATTAGLLGGGTPIKPGEVSLAHCGVLFLDELSEFHTSTLQSLRQPIESGSVHLTRAESSVRLPSRFMLVAASNPCPCGYLGDVQHRCTCTSAQILKYQGRIGGPLIDRISIRLDVERLPTSNVLSSGSGTDSATLREGVMRARAFMEWRMSRSEEKEGGMCVRSPRSPGHVIASCRLDDVAQAFVSQMAEHEGLSGRGLINTLKVARTIADMRESDRVSEEDLAEAFSLRVDGSLGDGYGT